MNFFKRLKSLWELSNFEILEFDTKMVITKEEGKLVFAKPQEEKPIAKAQIIRMNNPVQDFLKEKS